MASRDPASPPAATTLTLGRWLRELREKQGLAQREVAAAADMDSSHYGKVESGKRQLTDDQCAPIAARLGVAVDAVRARLLAHRVLQSCGGNVALAHQAADLVLQEEAAPYLVDNPVNKQPKKK